MWGKNIGNSFYLLTLSKSIFQQTEAIIRHKWQSNHWTFCYLPGWQAEKIKSFRNVQKLIEKCSQIHRRIHRWTKQKAALYWGHVGWKVKLFLLTELCEAETRAVAAEGQLIQSLVLWQSITMDTISHCDTTALFVVFWQLNIKISKMLAV